jgi:uncharacterized protein YegL
MLRRVLAILFFGFSLSATAQSNDFEDQTWDFGEIAFWHNDTAWFKVRNGTHRNLIFLPTYYNESFTILFSNRAADPGETIKIGIVYYTQRKGRFDVDVPMYINQKPNAIHFRIKGNIKGFDPAAQLRCPVINEGPSPQHLEKIVSIEVRDRITDELLMPDAITVKNAGDHRVDLERSGMEFEMSVMPGSYKVMVGKKTYEQYLALIKLEPYQNKFIVYLDKKPEIPKTNDDTKPGGEVADTLPLPKPVLVEKRVTKDTVAISVISKADHDVRDSIVIPGKRGKALDTRVYKFNNAILIVDVSSSMNRNGKLELLKGSFAQLVDALRAEDKIGVITMASEAIVVQEPTGVTEKDSLKSRVNAMKAAGGTNAGAAMQLAYQLAAANYIEDGNNQIIIATDGVFYGGSLSRQQMEKMIENANAKGIHLSTVGIGADTKAMDFLKNLASKGGGSFVQIKESYDEQANLLEMIKSQSLRNSEN